MISKFTNSQAVRQGVFFLWAAVIMMLSFYFMWVDKIAAAVLKIQ